jgi:hypothetical protein
MIAIDLGVEWLFIFERYIPSIVIGDINCNMIKSPKDSSAKKLIFLSALYNLGQLIKEPTRVTSTSSSLIDLVFTNQPNNISNSGVIDLEKMR